MYMRFANFSKHSIPANSHSSCVTSGLKSKNLLFKGLATISLLMKNLNEAFDVAPLGHFG